MERWGLSFGGLLQMKTFELNRVHQCSKCPWKKSTNPYEIPNGYSVEKHKALKETVASYPLESLKQTKAMACHESENDYCLGYLMNQLGRGNNLRLRIKFIACSNIDQVQLYGEQHKTIEETIPEGS